MKVVHVAVGVIARGDEIFITLRPDDVHQGGKWEFPGGKMEGKETPEETALQELLEETGIEPDCVIRKMPPHIDDDMKKAYHGIMARIRGKEPTVVLSDEHDKYQWLTPENALAMSDPLSHHAKYLIKYWKGLD